MRQVPNYLLIGNGRVARHISHYFSLLGLSFSTWHRQESLEKLNQQLFHATHILLLITDNAIEAFDKTYLTNHNAIKIHFSGSLVSSKIVGAHPLMTFSDTLYTLEQYRSIPFILDHDAVDFEKLLPGLPNEHVRLNSALKAKYHALCVLSGNFSCLLWQKLFSEFEHEFQFPHHIAHSYMAQQTSNLMANYKTALTGPLVRGDLATIEKNVASLQTDPFQAVYESFVACYQKLQMKPGEQI